MFKIVSTLCLIAAASAGVIHHDSDGHHATSYQHVKIENYHAVPVYIKKEHHQYLEHPVSAGHVDHGVQVHHGDGKHDPGYAIENHHGGHDDSGVAHLLAEHHDEGHQVAHEGLGAYAGHDSGYEHQGYAQLESHGYDQGGYEIQGHGSYQALGHGGHY